ncbi:Aste57867_23676 [Aphanomyces stellatus]|uniref:Aste57867_23676 protein n=1 Tax=Aphanomyces stellatus TaxID=120398 RepID=A0A485LNB0_9STRA|nr:hypothetical protein As57867_023604 [Aphanomyces stellatus]VFU00321.1 Aste57867_23676 [Aphanomyces stellatus]
MALFNSPERYQDLKMWSSQYSEEDEGAQALSQSQEAGHDREVEGENDPGVKLGDGEGLAEEMQAMKEVFLRMSEKKVRQKEQSQHDCVRVYSEAFQSDLDRLFATSKKARLTEAEKVDQSIQHTAMRLEEQKKELMDVHEAYEINFKASIETVELELERLKELRGKIVAAYEVGKQEVEKSFEEAFENLDAVTKRLHTQATEICGDSTYLKVFQSQVDRLA